MAQFDDKKIGLHRSSEEIDNDIRKLSEEILANRSIQRDENFNFKNEEKQELQSSIKSVKKPKKEFIKVAIVIAMLGTLIGGVIKFNAVDFIKDKAEDFNDDLITTDTMVRYDKNEGFRNDEKFEEIPDETQIHIIENELDGENTRERAIDSLQRKDVLDDNYVDEQEKETENVEGPESHREINEKTMAEVQEEIEKTNIEEQQAAQEIVMGISKEEAEAMFEELNEVAPEEENLIESERSR